MIDPVNVTNFNRTQNELEEFVLFCIAVAGKNATFTSKALDKLLNLEPKDSPFKTIKYLSSKYDLANLMKGIGFGCHSKKARGFIEISNSNFDLKTCTLEQLDSIYQIGMKTARYFVLHSRKNANVACLDTHVLKWLSAYSGFKIPKQTPSEKKYLELQQVFLNVAKVLNIHPATLDLKIWNMSRGSDEKSLDKTVQRKK